VSVATYPDDDMTPEEILRAVDWIERNRSRLPEDVQVHVDGLVASRARYLRRREGLREGLATGDEAVADREMWRRITEASEQ